MAPVDTLPGKILLSLAIAAAALPYGVYRWNRVRKSYGDYISESDPFKNEGFVYRRNIFGAGFLIIAGCAALLTAIVTLVGA